MRNRIRIVVGAIVALFFLNLAFAPDPLTGSRTSHGTTADGFAAVRMLLEELRLGGERSFERWATVPHDRTLWLLDPFFRGEADEEAADLLAWVEAGGTAVVFADDGGDAAAIGFERGCPGDVEGTRLVRGPDGTLRELRIDRRPHFEAVPAGSAVLLSIDDEPFVIETPRGEGRLVAVADASFLANDALAEGDASVLAVDLATRFGPAVLDERSHGLAPPARVRALVVDSGAWLPLLGLVSTLLLAVSAARRWPVRAHGETPSVRPALGEFADTMGSIYARIGDPEATFEAYRHGVIHRLRRLLRADGEETKVLERLARLGAVPDEAWPWLRGDRRPAGRHELVKGVRMLEKSVEAVS